MNSRGQSAFGFFRLPAFVAVLTLVSLPAAAAETWRPADGRTEFTFHPEIREFGLRITTTDSQERQWPSELASVSLATFPDGDARVTVSRGILSSLEGAIPHESGFALVGPGGVLRVSPLEIRAGEAPAQFVVASGPDERSAVLVLSDMSTAIDLPAGSMFLAFDRVTLAPAAAARLGVSFPEGASLGTVRVELRLAGADEVPLGAAAGPGPGTGCLGSANPPVLGPDVIVGKLSAISNYGSIGDVSAFAVGTDSCNIGDDCVQWVAGTNAHPVIAQNMYRLKNDRFEQIGMSWLKHGFTALAGTLCGSCTNPQAQGTLLGVGCSDPYSSSLNGTQTLLGPRTHVNAFSGLFEHPRDIPNPGCSQCNLLQRRLQVRNEDLDNPGALYFVDAQYVAQDDAAWGNGENNASYRPMFFHQTRCNFNPATPCDSHDDCTGPGRCANNVAAVCTSAADCPGQGRCELNISTSCDTSADCPFSGEACIKCRADTCGWPPGCSASTPLDGFCAAVTGSTQREQPAIRAWRDNDASVVETDVPVSGEGLFILAAKAVDAGSGQWRYEYAVQNINSDRSAGSFSIPLPAGAVVAASGFRDVDYHSGEPYGVTRCMTCETTPGITCVSASDCPNAGDRCLSNDDACPGAVCDSVCVGGLRAGNGCLSTLDCRVCQGGTNANLPCTTGNDCPNGACLGTCVGYCDKPPCTDNADCFGAACDVASGICENDWPAVVTPDAITWSTMPYATDPFANALRWATLYNFWFETNVTPDSTTATIGLFKPGGLGSVTGATVGPALGLIDCNSNGVADACDMDCQAPGCEPPCGFSSDCNGNGIPDEVCEPDCNGNGVADECDIVTDDGGLCTGPDCSLDCQPNTVPDECEADCNGDGVPDDCAGFDDCDGDGIEDCDDDCPCTTPEGSCVCPNDGCCFIVSLGECVEGVFTQASCEGAGHAWICNHAACRNGCLLGDWDGDGDIDLEDSAAFQNCFSGPAEDPGFISPSARCLATFDFDGDGDIDHADFKELELIITDPSGLFTVCPGLCIQCETDSDCDDGNACTTDSCKGSLCIHDTIPGCVPCELTYECAPIEVVFLMDTSGSMLDEAFALCQTKEEIVAELQGLGVTVQMEVLGVAETPEGFDCLTDTVLSLLCDPVECPSAGCNFPGGLSPAESWGPAAAVIAERYAWTEGATRIVVPLGDEGPCNGSLPDGCNLTGDDGASIDEAIAAALANGVVMSPITGTGSDACTKELAQALATATGGLVFNTNVAGTDLPQAVREILLANCIADDACDDQDACTENDACTDGVCDGNPVKGCQSCTGPADCDDGNLCTDDDCVEQACVFAPNFDAAAECCDPSTGGITPVDDGDPCTDDVCDPGTGIVTHPPGPDGTVCDDESFCNGADTCLGGTCSQHAGDPCANGAECANACDESTDSCNVASGTPCTDDGNPCTDNVCDGLGQCTAVNNAAPCDDNTFCNGTDTCSGGTCIVHSGDPCLNGSECQDACQEAAQSCNAPSGTVCTDDGNVCTDNVCDGAGACVAMGNTASCDDGDVCTINDACDGSGVCAGTPSNDPACSDIAEICLQAAVDGLGVGGCFTDSDNIVVNIVLTHSPSIITGGQFKISFNPADLQVLDVFPGRSVDPTSPFSFEVLEVVDNAVGSIFYVVGTAPGVPGTTGPAIVASIRFRALSTCTNIGPLCFDPNPLPNTALTDDFGQKVPFTTCCSEDLRIAGDALQVDCPGDVTRNVDAGTLTSLITWSPPTVTGGCSGGTALECTAVHSDGINIDHLIQGGGLFPVGTSTFECFTADGCGGDAACSWTVQVNPSNSFEVNVQISPTMDDAPLVRCIEFQFFANCTDPPVVVQQELQFGPPYSFPGQVANVAFKIPAGKYACVTARDPLHTLRSVSPMEIVNGQSFRAVFEGDPLFGGNWLVGGNLNGDRVIDILDFGVFVAEQLATPALWTPCGLPGPHADINGDGMVDSLDLSFIESNFYAADKQSCCPGAAGIPAPVLELAVDELDGLGLSDLRPADLNADGLINFDDVRQALRGGLTGASKPRNRPARR